MTTDAAMVAPTDYDIEQHRRELTGYCYRMLGSGSEAEDAVQETMVKAWKGIDRFEGRSSVRSWLYRIATNVCLDMMRGPQRRARPMDLGPSSPIDDGARRRGAARARGCSPSPTNGSSPPTATRPRSLRHVSRSSSPSSPRCSTSPPDSARCSSCVRCSRWQAVGGRRAARHERRLGQQRPAAGEGDARRQQPRRATRPTHRRRPDRAPRSLRRRLRALRHHRARDVAPRGRRDVDAAVPTVAAGTVRHRRLVPRHGHRVQGLAPRRHEGQRRCRVRRLPRRSCGRMVAVVTAAHRGARRADLWSSQLLEHRAARAVRAPARLD
ncbi:MAG: sigma-70 family RNA polymerase sigma factor [Ilumatobacteraceae bacterium]